MIKICEKCNAEVTQYYCSNCGHPIALPRIDGHYLLQEIRSAFSLEKGFLLTVRELATNPGKSIKDFLNKDRNRLVKPIIFLIVTSLIYSALANIFQFEDGYASFSDTKESTTLTIFNWVQNNYGYANIILTIFIGSWIKIFFRKHNTNIFEILVLLCYVMGMGMLIYSVFGIVQGLTSFNLMQIAGIIGFLYLTFAIGQFFGKGTFINYVKALFAYILGMLTFAITTLIIGNMIDLIF
ncbi:DUF3667 domain-containing protein [Peijinzhouia sedimentorum]